ncbi:MAG: response regulator transcription factor [Acidobacteriota bacterium]
MDDHAVVRQGTRGLVETAPDIEIVGEAENGAQAVERYRELRPDVVLMDLVMPGMDGADATRAILVEEPSARILLLTASVMDERIFTAIEAGAMGYLSKSAAGKEYVSSIRRIHAGLPAFPPEITQKIVERLQGVRSERWPLAEELTPREEDILRLVAQGMSNRQVADTIHIAEATVRTHVSRILGKLQVKNRVEAALWAVRHRLVDLDSDDTP